MKTILITAGGERLIPRYFLRRGFVTGLTSDGKTRVVLLVVEKEKELYEKEFGGKNVTVVGMPSVTHPRSFEYLVSLSRVGLNIKLSKPGQWTELYCGTLPFWKYWRNLGLSYALGTSPLICRAVQETARSFVSRMRTPDFVKEVFELHKPDLLYTTSLINTSFDLPVLVEAKRRGIKTVATLRGWDALTNYGFLLAYPDYLLLPNEHVRDAVGKYHFFSKEKVRVIGFPHFDVYLATGLIKSRADFLKSMGIDSAKRVVLFGGTADIVIPEREINYARIFDKLVKDKKIPSDLVMIFRSHPNASPYTESISHLSSIVVDAKKAKELPRPGSPEEDLRDVSHQINSLYHSEMVLTPGGTIVLDAVAFDKPVGIMAYNGGVKTSYYRSAARPHDGMSYDWTAVWKCKGMQKISSDEDFAKVINEYLKNSSLDREGRSCIRSRFIDPFDGRSSERLADALLSFL